MAALAKEYEDLLRSRQAVDFTAMLAWPLQLFEQHPRVLHGQQRAYRVLLCDEFQDVCPAQYALVRRLAATHGNVTAVGDPRQTIYGWRGADAALLLAFQRDFPGAQLLTLDQNFRSTRRIVAFANALGAPLEHLEYRRSLWTDNEDGSAVVVHAARDEAAEAAFVAEEIVRLWEGGQVAQLGEVAVLYRTNRQADPFALALRSRGLPYLVWGGGDLFARRELRDLVAYLRLAVNPHDHAALARIVDTPPRGLAALARHLRAEPATTDELPALARQHAPAHVHAADELRDLIYRLHACSRDGPPAQVLDAVLEPSGYAVWLARLADGRERLERIDALRRLAQSGRRDTAAWLAELRLGEPVHDPAVGAERAKRDSGGTEDARDAGLARVMLTTVHAAKGKEWRVVFVAGAEEGLLPHARSLLEAGDGSNGSDQRAALADELRVAFVAVTRARDCLYLTYSRRRRRGDVLEPRQPSRFLRPVPAELFAADAADQRAA